MRTQTSTATFIFIKTEHTYTLLLVRVLQVFVNISHSWRSWRIWMLTGSLSYFSDINFISLKGEDLKLLSLSYKCIFPYWFYIFNSYINFPIGMFILFWYVFPILPYFLLLSKHNVKSVCFVFTNTEKIMFYRTFSIITWCPVDCALTTRVRIPSVVLSRLLYPSRIPSFPCKNPQQKHSSVSFFSWYYYTCLICSAPTL